MARPGKKSPEEWRAQIISAASRMFITKGFKETSISDIMAEVKGAKGLFYRYFESKEEVMKELGDRMFSENNPFAALRGRTDITGLEKIREIIKLGQADTAGAALNLQAIPILKNPHILAAAIESNRRVLTPLWRELLEEGLLDGSVKTEYSKELSELLPLINFWLMPSIYPDSAEGISHKFNFIVEVLAKMGLPLLDDEMMAGAKKHIEDIAKGQ